MRKRSRRIGVRGFWETKKVPAMSSQSLPCPARWFENKRISNFFVFFFGNPYALFSIGLTATMKNQWQIPQINWFFQDDLFFFFINWFLLLILKRIIYLMLFLKIILYYLHETWIVAQQNYFQSIT
jgi:hypothetical protein